ncbi:MAG TPA: DivIVA domain-containing protein [Micromonospora sp.]
MTSGHTLVAPWHLRDRRFGVRLRGLDPTEVYGFLTRVANDLAAVYAELAAARNENQRIKEVLRQWQTEPVVTGHERTAGRRTPDRPVTRR